MGDLYVVIGGRNWTKIRPHLGVRKVGLYNDNGFVKYLPDLIMGRYGHACARFQNRNGDMVSVILSYTS